MNKIITTLIIVFFSTYVISQNQVIEISYGGSFAGFGDGQGKFMTLGYKQPITKHLSIYGQVCKSSMSGNKISYIHADKLFLGGDYIGNSVLDINDFFNNGNIINDRLLGIGSELHYDPPFSIINELHFDLGTNLSILRKGKFVYYIEGNLSLVKLEVYGTAMTRDVYINHDSWVNDPTVVIDYQQVPRRVLINASYQDHFLDFGYGYGIGIDYFFYDYFIIGANAHYNQYLNDAQNFATWGLKIGLKI